MSAIVAVTSNWPEGATFLEIAASLNPPPPLRNVQRWLNQLVAQKRLVRTGITRAARYKPAAPVQPEPLLFGSPTGRAIHQLVTQPLVERAPADYRRVALERYRPNETCYLPTEVRARIAATGGGGAWRAMDGARCCRGTRLPNDIG